MDRSAHTKGHFRLMIRGRARGRQITRDFETVRWTSDLQEKGACVYIRLLSRELAKFVSSAHGTYLLYLERTTGTCSKRRHFSYSTVRRVARVHVQHTAAASNLTNCLLPQLFTLGTFSKQLPQLFACTPLRRVYPGVSLVPPME
jgi:hypothetical protein